ncbi:MAG: SDR family oxidoreductase [Bacteroidales bacterium]
MNIIVTGASRGIGLEIVKALAATNHSIFAVSRNIKALMYLEGVCRKIHEQCKVYTVPFDLESGDYNRELLPNIIGKEERIDVLINNAGAMINKPFIEVSDQEFDRVFSVNVKAPFKMIRALFPHFRKNAHIVNIGSMGGFPGSIKFPGLSVYSASKGALATLTEALAEEFKDKGIRVNCLALGAARTEMLAEAFPDYNAPLSAGEMAVFISDFALTGHKYFNGKVLPVAVSTP